jgi:hypothetical protein
MPGWYKVTLPAKEAGIGGKAVLLQQMFEKLFIAHQAPREAALFTDHDDTFENHFYYFTPVGADIAKIVVNAFDGTVCPAPRRHDRMTLLVGHADARKDLLRPVD